MRHTLAVLVENRPGVLAHIAGLFSRRAFNIESIAAGRTEEPDLTRITIVVDGDEQLDQVTKQLNKLVDVVGVTDFTETDSIDRELALVKVRALPGTRSDLVNIANVFRANVVDVTREAMVLELTGDEDKIDALCEVLQDHGIIELVRTGKIALERGSRPAKADMLPPAQT